MRNCFTCRSCLPFWEGTSHCLFFFDHCRAPCLTVNAASEQCYLVAWRWTTPSFFHERSWKNVQNTWSMAKQSYLAKQPRRLSPYFPLTWLPRREVCCFVEHLQWWYYCCLHSLMPVWCSLISLRCVISLTWMMQPHVVRRENCWRPLISIIEFKTYPAIFQQFQDERRIPSMFWIPI